MADKRTASQRIDDLERAVMSIFNVTNNIARDLTLIKNAIKLIDSKVASIMEASCAGKPLTDEVISFIMREKELQELKDKVLNLVTQGFLTPTETAGEGTFVVGSEDEPDAEDGTPGKVVHARLQFTVASLDKDLQSKFTGVKVGETIKFKDDALVFKVKEVYKIINPTPPEVPAGTPLTAEERAANGLPALAPDAAPTEPQSSSDAESTQTAPVAAPSSQAAGT